MSGPTRDLLRQRALIAYLRTMGDPRMGGALPIGGKGAAGSYSTYADGIDMREGGINTFGRFGGAREPGLLYSPIGRAGEEEVYNHLMNLKEQELEDEMIRQRRGRTIADTWRQR